MASVDELKIAGQSSIDELKIAGTSSVSSVDELHVKSYSEYFGEMELTDEEVEKRIDTAEGLEEAFLFLFLLLLMMEENDEEPDEEDLVGKLTVKIKEVLVSVNIDLLKGYNYLTTTVVDIAREVVDTTLRNKSNKYFTASDRAKVLAEENANTIHNNILFHNAVKKGCNEKQWITMKDDRVRHTHVMVDDVKVGINEKFLVGNSLMLYPRDTSADYCEIANCRCTLKYLKDGKEQNIKSEEDKEAKQSEKTFLSTVDELTIR